MTIHNNSTFSVTVSMLPPFKSKPPVAAFKCPSFCSNSTAACFTWCLCMSMPYFCPVDWFKCRRTGFPPPFPRHSFPDRCCRQPIQVRCCWSADRNCEQCLGVHAASNADQIRHGGLGTGRPERFLDVSCSPPDLVSGRPWKNMISPPQNIPKKVPNFILLQWFRTDMVWPSSLLWILFWTSCPADIDVTVRSTGMSQFLQKEKCIKMQPTVISCHRSAFQIPNSHQLPTSILDRSHWFSSTAASLLTTL